MSIFDQLNRACVDVFSDSLLATYTHFPGWSDSDVKVILTNRIDEPSAPGPLCQVSLVPADLSAFPEKRDTIQMPNGDVYVVTEIRTDDAGMVHLTVHQQQ